MEVFQNLLKICELLEDKKAEDILIIDARKMNNVADFYIIATSTSNTHTKGVADFLETEVLKLKGFNYVNREGFNLSDWVVLDFNNVFVHILTKQKREYYSLEKLLNEGNNIKSYDRIKKETVKQENKQAIKTTRDNRRINKIGKLNKKRTEKASLPVNSKNLKNSK